MMQAATLLENLQSVGVSISVQDGKLKVDSPRNKLTPDVKELLKLHKAEIIQRLKQPVSLAFQDRINMLINQGIRFEVETERFEMLGDGATEEGKDFLTVNAPFVLCHLQQMALMRDVFNHQSEALEDFRNHVAETEAIYTDGAEVIPPAIHKLAVIETTKRWFADIYKEVL